MSYADITFICFSRCRFQLPISGEIRNLRSLSLGEKRKCSITSAGLASQIYFFHQFFSDSLKICVGLLFLRLSGMEHTQNTALQYRGALFMSIPSRWKKKDETFREQTACGLFQKPCSLSVRSISFLVPRTQEQLSQPKMACSLPCWTQYS